MFSYYLRWFISYLLYWFCFILCYFYSIMFWFYVVLNVCFQFCYVLSSILVFMFDFEFGFISRSLHIVFTSLIYCLLYLHIFKCIFLLLLFDVSLLVWFVGFFLYFFIVFIAFIGYVLPCTQMSYWGLTVFSNIIATLPLVGLLLCYWLWGCEYIQDFTLIKCHSLHIIFPLLLLFLILLHFFCLHYFISSDGFYDRFAFYCERLLFVLWFYLRDLFFGFILIFIYFYYIFCYWYFVFHEESFDVVDVLKTSDKIIPEWFFLLFFGFIKSIPDKFYGVVVLFFFYFFYIFVCCFMSFMICLFTLLFVIIYIWLIIIFFVIFN